MNDDAPHREVPTDGGPEDEGPPGRLDPLDGPRITGKVPAVPRAGGPQIRLEPIDVSAIAGKAPGNASIAKQREDVREYLAKRLLGLLAGTLLLGAVMMMTRRWTEISAEDTRLFFQVAFSAIIALVSAATGFYFGSGSGAQSGDGGPGADGGGWHE